MGSGTIGTGLLCINLAYRLKYGLREALGIGEVSGQLSGALFAPPATEILDRLLPPALNMRLPNPN